jgi:hypothetical protein
VGHPARQPARVERGHVLRDRRGLDGHPVDVSIVLDASVNHRPVDLLLVGK